VFNKDKHLILIRLTDFHFLADRLKMQDWKMKDKSGTME